MIEKLFHDSTKVESHKCAPMLMERELYLRNMENQGFCLRYLQMTADYLFFAVKNLDLDSNSIVSLERIVQSSSEWYTSKKRHYQVTVIKWLCSIGMLDRRYDNPTILFNSFSSISYYRVRYLTYPLYQERMDYLLREKALGRSYSSLREMAEMQLHIVDALKLHTLRGVSLQELREALPLFKSKKSKKNFMATAKGWLSYMGMLSDANSLNYDGYNDVVAYLNWAQESKGLRSTTLIGRKRELKIFMSFIESKHVPLSGINLNHIDEYIIYRQNSGCNRRTISTVITTLRDFIRYACNEDIVMLDANFIKHPKSYSLDTLPNSPSWSQTKELVQYYNDKVSALHLRNKAIMYLLATYGLRSSEVVNLKMKDINWKDSQISLHRAKCGGLQMLPLVPLVGNAIAEYISKARRNDVNCEYVFLRTMAPITRISRTSVYAIVSKAYSNMGIAVKHKGGHSLRHACATHLINSGHSLKEISDLLGHRLLDTTWTYAKVDLSTLRQVAEIDWEGLICQ